MRDEQQPAAPSDGLPADVPSLEALRQILFEQDRSRIDQLEAELDSLERQVTDREALIATISPVLGDAIRRQIRDAREEMVEALYPIIGQLVVRAVSEAVRDLARTVDAQVRRSFDIRALWWRLRARLGGASQAETSLRASLPFEVSEILMVHRETSLLLRRVSRDPAAAQDSDLVGSMLTAIRDFAQDAFGRGREGELEEIEFGDQRILIEAARHAYLAVVVDGVEPPGFRAEMRERIVEIEHDHAQTLLRYDGDASPLAVTEKSLRSLMKGVEPHRLTGSQKALMAALASLLVVCMAAACLAGRWVWGGMVSTPTLVPVAIMPTAIPTLTHTPAPTFTPTWTATAVPSSTPTSTFTPTPSHTPSHTPTAMPTATPRPSLTPTPAPVIGLMTGNAWLRQGPGADFATLGMVAERGQQIELLAVLGDWCQIRWIPHSQAQVIGWVPLRWVGTLEPIPAWIVTPTVGP